VLEPAKVGVELVARNETGPDPARDRLQLAVANQCANLFLGAAQLGGKLADCQGCGPIHSRSIAFTAHARVAAALASRSPPAFYDFTHALCPRVVAVLCLVALAAGCGSTHNESSRSTLRKHIIVLHGGEERDLVRAPTATTLIRCISHGVAMNSRL
jgi:hypothetical protein